MGSLLSRIRLIYHTLKSISDSFSVLSERISHGPGLPGANPSRSYWCIPRSPLDGSVTTSIPLPHHADVVIIGSGIAGTAIARTLLDSHASHSDEGPLLRVVMLEARDVCSGATGRNGGHISPNTYQDYSELAAKYGTSAAQAIVRFRLAHLPALLAVAQEEDLLRESQARRVEQFDIFLQGSLYRRAKDMLAGYLTAMPEMHGIHKTCEDKPTLETLQLCSRTTGFISQPGGALHPYRLITGILSRLVATYSSFQLFTHTPCTDLSLAADGRSYLLTTPKGTFTASHVVHATNAWAAHLLQGMRRTIVPVRVHMAAQRSGRALGQVSPSWAGKRSFVFYPGTSMFGFDYLTQQPPPSASDDAHASIRSTDTKTTINAMYPAPKGELMFGGGALMGGRAEAVLMDNIGITDDSESDFEVSAYLGGALERYFEPGWGEEALGSETSSAAGKEDAQDGWGAGRMKAAWSGIMGLSADGQPWVGRVPRAISKRAEPEFQPTPSSDVANSLARPGEWIAAGFTGEGMTHAWLAGVALARMVLGSPSPSGADKDDTKDNTTPDASALPLQFLITEKRWKEADFEAFLAEAA